MAALTRLLSEGSLRALHIINNGIQLQPSADFCSALRSCSLVTLTYVSPAIALVDAVTGHRTLQVISLGIEYGQVLNAHDLPTIGAALGRLVGANSPSLTSLDLYGCGLGEVGLRALFDALQSNTHLRSLECGWNEITHSVALLTAVTWHATLQHLGLA